MASARKEWNGNEIFDDLESALPCYANILVQNVTFILRDILSPEEASNHEILYIRKPLRPERSLWKKCFWRHCIEGDQHFPEKMRDNSDHSLPFLKLVYAVVDIYSRAKLIFALRKTQEAEHRRVIKLPRKKSSLKT